MTKQERIQYINEWTFNKSRYMHRFNDDKVSNFNNKDKYETKTRDKYKDARGN